MIDKIKAIVESEINPILALHNGSCEVLGYKDNILSIRLNGGCVGCPSSKITLMMGVEPILKDHFPDIKDVVLE